MGVAAHHDVLDAEDLHGVLDGRRLSGGGGGAVGGNDVAGGAQFEQLAGPSARDEGRYDPGVGAGDEQDLGGLARGEAGELLGSLSEGARVVDEGLHGVVIPPGAP